MFPSGSHWQVPMVAARDVLARPPRLVVDLRSPAEYGEDHLPGAVNVPLFDDAERALIGTLYARKSPAAAFEEGARRTQAKIGALVGELARLAGWEIAGGELEARVEALCARGIEGLERELVVSRGALAPETVVL